jgi:hypothetical protein
VAVRAWAWHAGVKWMDYGIIGSTIGLAMAVCGIYNGERVCMYAFARSQHTTLGQVEKDESDALGATNKYCAKAIGDEEDGKKDNENGDKDEEEKRRMEAQPDDDDLNALKAPFSPLPSSPTLYFVLS